MNRRAWMIVMLGALMLVEPIQADFLGHKFPKKKLPARRVIGEPSTTKFPLCITQPVRQPTESDAQFAQRVAAWQQHCAQDGRSPVAPKAVSPVTEK
jgi:hypothetical protein